MKKKVNEYTAKVGTHSSRKITLKYNYHLAVGKIIYFKNLRERKFQRGRIWKITDEWMGIGQSEKLYFIELM